MFKQPPYKVILYALSSADKSHVAFPFFLLLLLIIGALSIASLSNENRVFYPLLLSKRKICPWLVIKNSRLFPPFNHLFFIRSNKSANSLLAESAIKSRKVNGNLGLPGDLGQHLKWDINTMIKPMRLETIQGGKRYFSVSHFPQRRSILR